MTGLAPCGNPYGKPFKYIIKSRGPRIEPWQTPLATVSQLEDLKDHNAFILTLNMEALKPPKQQESLTQNYSAKLQTT
jgi:hypothetical protein